IVEERVGDLAAKPARLLRRQRPFGPDLGDVTPLTWSAARHLWQSTSSDPRLRSRWRGPSFDSGHLRSPSVETFRPPPRCHGSDLFDAIERLTASVSRWAQLHRRKRAVPLQANKSWRR